MRTFVRRLRHHLLRPADAVVARSHRHVRNMILATGVRAGRGGDCALLRLSAELSEGVCIQNAVMVVTI